MNTQSNYRCFPLKKGLPLHFSKGINLEKNKEKSIFIISTPSFPSLPVKFEKIIQQYLFKDPRDTAALWIIFFFGGIFF
jgi:hypothetical protein